ncbi:hypothetical protein Ae201684_005629 [Aphanomyces euteiches]|uniref:Uncharacterized protein n=1 Tax=Aphanomyces euteiches TaxID=100861 RepID=A0A6G0XEC6_9STRA|nr:hypothetical protein Ae201684_005629 [Aphanomyces euteiches]
MCTNADYTTPPTITLNRWRTKLPPSSYFPPRGDDSSNVALQQKAGQLDLMVLPIPLVKSVHRASLSCQPPRACIHRASRKRLAIHTSGHLSASMRLDLEVEVGPITFRFCIVSVGLL